MKKLLLFVIISIVGISMAVAQPIIKVWGSDDSLAHVTQIRHWLEYLDVREAVYLYVSFRFLMPENLEGKTLVQRAPMSDGGQFVMVIKVWVDAGLPKVKQRLVLAHEMIHVKQIAKGELVLDKQQVFWKGRRYYDCYYDPQRAPWEREAYHLDHTLAKISEPPMLVPTASLTGY